MAIMDNQKKAAAKKRILAVAELFSYVTNTELLKDAFSELGGCLVHSGFAKYESSKRSFLGKYDNDELLKIALSFFEINESILQDDLACACRTGVSCCKLFVEQNCKNT